MRNITGSPVTGDDFFDRPDVRSRFLRDLIHNNLLLVAPRRVGKTSLVMKICEVWRADTSRRAVFVNVESVGDELTFVERMLDEFSQQQLHPDLLSRALSIFRKVRDEIGSDGLKIAGLDISLGNPDADDDQATLSKVVRSVLRKIEAGEAPMLIAIDELPVFLLNLAKKENGPARVSMFLHWLRDLRESYGTRVRWIFLGSVGLDSFVEDRGLQGTLNNLQIKPLEALNDTEAGEFLRRLAEDNAVTLTEEQRADIIRRVGWCLPYHLQLVFHEIRDQGSSSVESAFESLLQPQKLIYFDTWRQRLDEQFGREDSTACKSILKYLCEHATGRQRRYILDALMKRPGADIEKVEEQVARLLMVLLRDGYLHESDGRYAFRSFLLREYWYRRHVK